MAIGDQLGQIVRGAALAAAVPANGGSRARPIRLVAADNTDASGDAQLELEGFTAGEYAAWNVYVTVDGGGSFALEVDQGSMPAGGALGTNGVAIGGAFVTWGTDTVTLTVTGAAASSIVRAQASGIQSPVLDDVMSFPGPSFSSVGAHQTDPSKLLPGQVGPALLENYGNTVPGTGSHSLGVGTFDVAGYAALLVYADPPPGSSSLFMWLRWFDQTGTPFAYSQLDAVCPKLVAVVGCLSSTFELFVGNVDSTAHNIAGLTVIPLAQMPAAPELLIPIGGDIPGFAGGPSTPSAKTVLEVSGSVPASGTITGTANFVWPGKAVWSVGSGSGSSVTQLDGTLTCIDVNGVSTLIARTGTGTSDNPPPVVVELTSGLAQVVIRNQGAAAVNGESALVATS